MERTKNNTVEPNVITWKKVGGGSLRLKGKIIKPGQLFEATPDEIPALFKNLVVPMGELPKAADVPSIKVTKTEYKMVPRGKSNTWFDIVGPNEKVINEKALTKEAAANFIKTLS